MAGTKSKTEVLNAISSIIYFYEKVSRRHLKGMLKYGIIDVLKRGMRCDNCTDDILSKSFVNDAFISTVHCINAITALIFSQKAW